MIYMFFPDEFNLPILKALNKGIDPVAADMKKYFIYDSEADEGFFISKEVLDDNYVYYLTSQNPSATIIYSLKEI